MFETMSVEICDALKKTFVTAWVHGAPSRQAHAAVRVAKEFVFINYGSVAWIIGLIALEAGEDTSPIHCSNAIGGMSKPGGALRQCATEQGSAQINRTVEPSRV